MAEEATRSAEAPVLPIRLYAEDIRKAVAANDVVVVIGETGSGKTTQLSQVRAPLPAAVLCNGPALPVCALPPSVRLRSTSAVAL